MHAIWRHSIIIHFNEKPFINIPMFLTRVKDCLCNQISWGLFVYFSTIFYSAVIITDDVVPLLQNEGYTPLEVVSKVADPVSAVLLCCCSLLFAHKPLQGFRYVLSLWIPILIFLVLFVPVYNILFFVCVQLGDCATGADWTSWVFWFWLARICFTINLCHMMLHLGCFALRFQAKVKEATSELTSHFERRLGNTSSVNGGSQSNQASLYNLSYQEGIHLNASDMAEQHSPEMPEPDQDIEDAEMNESNGIIRTSSQMSRRCRDNVNSFLEDEAYYSGALLCVAVCMLFWAIATCFDVLFYDGSWKLEDWFIGLGGFLIGVAPLAITMTIEVFIAVINLRMEELETKYGYDYWKGPPPVMFMLRINKSLGRKVSIRIRAVKVSVMPLAISIIVVIFSYLVRIMIHLYDIS
jgi:hypothetical protein